LVKVRTMRANSETLTKERWRNDERCVKPQAPKMQSRKLQLAKMRAKRPQDDAARGQRRLSRPAAMTESGRQAVTITIVASDETAIAVIAAGRTTVDRTDDAGASVRSESTAVCTRPPRAAPAVPVAERRGARDPFLRHCRQRRSEEKGDFSHASIATSHARLAARLLDRRLYFAAGRCRCLLPRH